MIEIIPKKFTQNKKEDFRDYAFRPIFKIMEKNKKVFLLTNDMGAKGLDDLRQKFPERVINAGISEQNIASVAGGLAKSGNYVYIYGIISHIIFRSLEQIKIDICLPNLPVTILGVGAGLSYGQDGPTHHGIEDCGIASVLPNLNIYNPSDYISTYQAVLDCYRHKKPSYIRLDKEKLPNIYNLKDKFENMKTFGKHSQNLLVASGISLWICLKVKEILKKKINLLVLDFNKLTYFNITKIKKVLKKTKNIIIVEENIDSSSIIFNELLKIKNLLNLKNRISIINLKKKYFLGSSSRKYIWKKNGLFPAQISKKILNRIYF